MPDIMSTAILRLSYDAFARELDVVFISGRHFRYFNIPASAYRAFVDAPSKAVFFDRQIRDRYACAEIVEKPRQFDPLHYRQSA